MIKEFEIEIDEKLYYESKIILNKLGYTFNQAINLLFKQTVLNHMIPFRVEYYRKPYTIDEVYEIRIDTSPCKLFTTLEESKRFWNEHKEL